MVLLAQASAASLESGAVQQLQHLASCRSSRSLRRMMSVRGALTDGDAGSEDQPNECEICYDADVAVEVVECGHWLCGASRPSLLRAALLIHGGPLVTTRFESVTTCPCGDLRRLSRALRHEPQS